MFNASKTSLGDFEFTPYGGSYHFNGPADLTHLFTGHDLDPLTGNYYALFRYLNPSASRWLHIDPLGMINGPNMYGYVGGNPIVYDDPYGLFWGWGTAGIGAIAGGLGAGAWNLGGQLVGNWRDGGGGIDWGAVGSDAAAGAIAGGLFGGFVSGDPTFWGAAGIVGTAVGAGFIGGGLAEGFNNGFPPLPDDLPYFCPPYMALPS